MKLTKEMIQNNLRNTHRGLNKLSITNVNKDWNDIDERERNSIIHFIVDINQYMYALYPEVKVLQNKILKDIGEAYNDSYKLTEVPKLTKEFLQEYSYLLHKELAFFAEKNKNIKFEDIGIDIQYFKYIYKFEYLVKCFFGNLIFSSKMKFLEMLAELYNKEYMIKDQQDETK